MSERLVFEVGDVVKLKSGSPRMTVSLVNECAATDPDGTHSEWCEVEVEWFDVRFKPDGRMVPHGEPRKATFDERMLEHFRGGEDAEKSPRPSWSNEAPALTRDELVARGVIKTGDGTGTRG